MNMKRILLLGLLALIVSLGVRGEPSDLASAAPEEVASPHGGYGFGTTQCLTCHSVHARQQLLSDALCERCHALPTHMEQSCIDCHDPHGQTDNLALIRETVNGQPVVFRQMTGTDSLSEGADDPDALCVACHTETQFHRHNAPKTHFEGQDCTRCHQHQFGFRPENIGCRDCHTVVPLPSGDHPVHAEAPYGPLNNRCSMCHQKVTTWKVHRDGKIEFADRKRFDETMACDTCHGLGGTQAKALWGTRQRLDCLTCHNAEQPAQINGATASPTGEFWTTSGHGNTAGFASGNPGAGLTCETCHDPNAPHIGTANANSRLRTADINALCLSCHGAGGSASTKVSTHGNTHFTLRFQGQFQIRCTECHDPHGTRNLAMIRAEIRGNPVIFTARTGADSFDEPDDDNRDDLCATCHTQTEHNRLPSNRAQTSHFEGVDCTTCHKHDRDNRPETVDGFVLGDIGCNFCHGQPPPPASAGYPLDETKTPHQIHAADSGYGFGCERCHDTGNPNYAGHRTTPPSFQDVWFDGFNPEGQYNPETRTCGGVYCHSNGEPAGMPIEYRPMVWAENVGLGCNGCHGDATSLMTNAHSKHLLPQYRDRGETSIGCYECHSTTAVDDNNTAIANRNNHADRRKQIAIDETDLWGDAGLAAFDSRSLSCATSRCHSDGAASRTSPGEPTYASPVWTDPASGACGTCHGITQETLTTGLHPLHLIFATCDTCHAGYGPAHVNGRVEFADGNTFPNTTVCRQCHSSQTSERSEQPASETLTPTEAPATPEDTAPTPVPPATEAPVPTPIPIPTLGPVPLPVPVPRPLKPTLPPVVPIPPPVPPK